ncbi:MAG: DUF559 domain-containing protein [Anaerolineae bacterium]|nr:DUF559 domain-containing protein [Anaerolineae bacterium]MCI0609433.1 DUF559 domain-containing protein [Anaerolineae bacterium]
MKRKRTTPKIFRRAKELRRKMTPIEIKLWGHLRAHRMNGVHFRNPTRPIGHPPQIRQEDFQYV